MLLNMMMLQIFCIIFLSQYALSFDHTIICPKAFRVGAEETVVLNLHNYVDGATVSAYMQDLPDRDNTFSRINNMVVDQASASEPVTLQMQIDADDIAEYRNIQRVALVVQVRTTSGAGDFMEETEVLVSRQSGYIFVITNQPIYKPGDDVLIKIFTLDQTMRRDETSVRITIKTPDGVGVVSTTRALRSRVEFIDWSYTIDPNPEYGLWTVEVSYAENGYETLTDAKFGVDRYVIPTFQVRINMAKNFVVVTDSQIRGTVTAEYSYGRKVQGNMYMSMKVKPYRDAEVGEAIEFFTVPDEGLLTAFINDGLYDFTANIPNPFVTVRNTSMTINSILADGGSIFIDAAVTETGSGYLETASTPDIPIIASPYKIDTTRTSLYFNRGLAFVLRVDVLFDIGGSPADGVPYEVIINGVRNSGMTDDRGQINFPETFQNGNVQTIVVGVTGPGATNVTLNIEPYDSPNNKYLQINLLPGQNAVQRIDGTLQFVFRYNQNNLNEIRYFVIARGTIVYSDVNHPTMLAVESSDSFRIRSDMVPSARIVAYYLVGEEVVSNSLWFDVEEQCKSELSISLANDQVEPGAAVDINLQGAPNAVVAVTAIDRASYFLYNGSRLTRETMFKKMDSYDQGCVRNGGRDGPGVFWEAGLILTSEHYDEPTVYSIDCSERNLRKKRQAVVDEFDQTAFLNALAPRCLETGNLESPISRDTCEKRTKRCRETFDAECCEMFLNSCLAAEKQRNPQGTNSISTPATDSITTVEIDAVSMENDAKDGFCVARRKDLTIFRDVFIQVYAPFSLRKREQVNLRITVFNYGSRAIDIWVDVKPSDDGTLCTHYQPDIWSTLMSRRTIEPARSASGTLTVLPLKIRNNQASGTSKINFRVRDDQNRVVDKIEKSLLIEEEGEVRDTYASRAIDLVNNTEQIHQLHFDFPEKFVSLTRQCWLYVYSNFMGPTIEVDEINEEPRDIASILRIPRGCGEQNMIYSGPNVYAHAYLESTMGLVPNTSAYAASLKKMSDGYVNELKYRSDRVMKKAWAVFNTWAPSTWLNAYVNKVFLKSNLYVDLVDIQPICSSLRWLLTQQQDDGHFQELQPPIHREMHGAVGGDLTLTAYVVISLLETPSRCNDSQLNQDIAVAVTNAMNYLISEKDSTTFSRTFGIALFSYALALHQPGSDITREMFERLMDIRIVEDGRISWMGRSVGEIAGTDIHAYWYNAKPLAVHIEATAYALLALMEKETRTNNPPSQRIVEICRKVVLWLIYQRNDGGAFTSTQDTVIGLQALATYQMWIAEIGQRTPTAFSVKFTAQGTVWDDVAPQFPNLTESDARYRKELPVPEDVVSRRNVTVIARGSGEGVVSYRCIYRTLFDEESCYFNISTNVEVDDTGANTKIKLTVSVFAKYNATEMSIVEVGLMTGFVPIERTVIRLSTENAVDGAFHRYEITNVSVIFYLRNITNDPDDPYTLSFDLEQRIVVDQPQPAKINVYDYYEPSIHCGIFYSLANRRTRLLTSNCGGANRTESLCSCAEGGCLRCRPRADQLRATTCLVGIGCDDTCKVGAENCTNLFVAGCRNSNYVYEVNVTSVEVPAPGDQFYHFNASMISILKEGNIAGLQRDNILTFVVRRDCFENCNDPDLKVADNSNNEYNNFIKHGSTLLVMGRPAERFDDRNGIEQIQYRLDDQAIVERIVPNKACGRYRKKGCHEDMTANDNCERFKELYDACENHKALKANLAEGCDAAAK